MPIAGSLQKRQKDPNTCTFVQAKDEVKADIQNNMPAKNASTADNRAGERGAESNGVGNKTSVAPVQNAVEKLPKWLMLRLQ